MRRILLLLTMSLAACEKSAAPPAAKDPAPVAHVDAGAAAAAPALPPAFAESLRRGGMTFTMPAGFTMVAPVENAQWKYDFAMRADDGSVEVRIRMNPLDQALAEAAKCKEDPGCHGTDPNNRKSSWLMVVAADIGGGMDMPQVNELGAEGVRHDFGADWGGVAAVVPGAEMKSEHKQATVVLLHKDDKADAIVALFHDGLRDEDIARAITPLQFAP